MPKKRVPTRAGDLVLVYYEDQPVVYARVDAIEPDIKKDWFQVSLTVLTIPLQTVTWILREEYVSGDGFTMGGKPMKLERVERAAANRPPEERPFSAKTKEPEKATKVLAFKKQH